MTGNKVALCSYPRSGNSLTRKLLEQVTGVATGCESKSDITIQMLGMPGESHSGNDRVWVTKTHHPFEFKFLSRPFVGNKQIYLMRNPIDVFPSHAYLMYTSSHALVPKEKLNEAFPEFWDDWVRWSSAKTAAFHEHVMTASSQAVPTLICRFEDLRSQPEKYLKQIFAFMLDVPSIEGTVCAARIKQVCEISQNARAIYKLKSKTTSLSKNMHMYSPEQVQRMEATMKDFLVYFGYTNHPEDGLTETSFFEYTDKEGNCSLTKDDFKQYKGYLEHNKVIMRQIAERASDREKSTDQQIVGPIPEFTF
jgi:hypothetical protein